MSFPPSVFKTWIAGETLTAADLNNSFQVIPNTNIPEDIDDFSVNATEMQSTADPYPAGTASLATTLSEELTRLRYQFLQALGANRTTINNWYEDFLRAPGVKGADVASAAALAPGTDGNFFDVTGTTSITSIGTLGIGAVIRLQFDSSLILTHHATDLVLPNGQNIRTKTGDIATFVEYATGDWMLVSFSRGKAEPMASYRRPNLVYVSATQLDVENNTGTQHETAILFPDGDYRTVTENTGSTHKYRRMDITADAEFTSGTEDSGLRAALTEATDTWYAIYAVKSAVDSSKFVLVGDTVLPLRANFATLNSAYGTNGWVYLGMIRNGDGSGATGDIVQFVQHGNKVTFVNVCAGAALNSQGIRMASSASTTTLSYTYAAGTGAAEIPNHIGIVNWRATSGDGGAIATLEDQATTSNTYIRVTNTPGLHGLAAYDVPAASGLNHRSSSAAAKSIFLAGFVDGVLGVSGNALL